MDANEKKYEVYRKYDADSDATLVKTFKTREAAEKFIAKKKETSIGEYFVFLAD